MRVEILHIVDCPNTDEAVANVSAALTELERGDTPILMRLLTSSADAAEVAFGGSPTILFDGVDAFAGDRTSDLACRVYLTPKGLAGAPSVAALVDAMRVRL